MSELRREVKTYEVDMPCRKCTDGRMRPTGKMFLAFPSRHQHLCDKLCGYDETYLRTYPYIAYGPKD